MTVETGEKLFIVHVFLYQKDTETFTRDRVYARSTLEEAALLGWQKVLEEGGGLLVYPKQNQLLGMFFPVGHPAHNGLVQTHKCQPNVHYFQLNTDIVNVLSEHCDIFKVGKAKELCYPGGIICGHN